MTYDARKMALTILNSLEKQDKTLDILLEDALENLVMDRRDTALIHALVYGVVRWRGKLDHIIGHFSRTGLNKIKPELLNILRMGLFQILELDRIPVSAAVNTSVELARSCAGSWATGFVNGLLRNAARNHEQVLFPDMAANPSAALAAEKSFPEWLIRRWLSRFGTEETAALCDAANRIPPITVRVNSLRTDREKLIEELRPYVTEIEPTLFSPDGLRFTSPQTAIPDMPPFRDGLFQVQDEAAQLVSFLLNPRPGERILDACAGLGGKTAHIARLMENQGEILALDNHQGRLERLAAEMERLEICMVTPRLTDLSEVLDSTETGIFDRILLDAPCSGLGVIRRNPDTRWSASKQNLKRYRERQTLFLHHLALLLRQGGVMVYAVCTTEPEENGQVIQAFLEQHPEFGVEMPPDGFPENARKLVTPQGWLMTFPHRHDMDGFFAVRLRKQ